MNPGEAIEARYPKLQPDQYQITSPPDDTYNCVGWIVRDVNGWWSPMEIDGYRWPDSMRADDDLSTHIAFFESLGFNDCAHAQLEQDTEKIAIYAVGDEFTHVAYQREDGSWSSKLGEAADIRHDTLAPFAGAGPFEFGQVVRIMSRSREPHDLANSGLLLP